MFWLYIDSFGFRLEKHEKISKDLRVSFAEFSLFKELGHSDSIKFEFSKFQEYQLQLDLIQLTRFITE